MAFGNFDKERLIEVLKKVFPDGQFKAVGNLREEIIGVRYPEEEPLDEEVENFTEERNKFIARVAFEKLKCYDSNLLGRLIDKYFEDDLNKYNDKFDSAGRVKKMMVGDYDDDYYSIVEEMFQMVERNKFDDFYGIIERFLHGGFHGAEREFIDVLKRKGCENYFDVYIREIFCRYFVGGNYNDEWLEAYGTNHDKIRYKNNFGKIYLNVEKKDIFKFANLLLDKCGQMGMDDYQFKINNERRMIRDDAVVIYFSEENFGKYITMIEQIKSENPDIGLLEPHCLAYRYNDYIGVGKDSKSDSYTSILCDFLTFLSTKRELNFRPRDYDAIADKAYSYAQTNLKDVIALCDKTKRGIRGDEKVESFGTSVHQELDDDLYYAQARYLNETARHLFCLFGWSNFLSYWEDLMGRAIHNRENLEYMQESLQMLSLLLNGSTLDDVMSILLHSNVSDKVLLTLKPFAEQLQDNKKKK